MNALPYASSYGICGIPRIKATPRGSTLKQRSSLLALRRLRAFIVTVGLVFAGVVGLTPQAQAADGNILPPFDLEQSWNICQGYNNAAVTHTGTSLYGLDLTGAGCDNSASGRTVRAPMGGTVHYYQASYGNLCVNVTGGRSYTLTHINSSVTSGSVTAGQSVGTVSAPGTRGNNGVAHIHFQMWDTANCYSSSGIPFDSAHGTRICGAPDLTSSGPNGGNGTWSGTSFTGQNCGSSGGTGSFSGDGNADILWYESWNNGGTAKMIKTNSSGSGTESSNAWFSGYAKPTWAAIGNFTGGPDKKEDIAWYESWNNGTLKVIPSNGSSSGTPITWFSGYAAPSLAFAADFNGDKRDDIAWFEVSNNGTMKVIPTNSAGTGGAASYTWFSGYAKPDWADAG